MTESLLTIYQVIEQTGLARSTIYARMKEQNFPRPIGVGKRSKRWISTVIDHWVAEQIAASKTTT
ncbi:MAG: AlpA family phage regulatory protein [Alphaproteobacteria bacterium]|nr:AlpA family phage regulatory protein [Alphaproteobacteria bacterium]